MKTRKHCNQQFDLTGRTWSNHVRWCPERPKSNKKNIIANEKFAIVRYGEIKDFEVSCNKCNETFVVSEREKSHPKKSKYFCSKSCANSRDWSDDKYKKSLESRSNKMKNIWNDSDYRDNQAKHNVNNLRFSSKNERFIREYFMRIYESDNWTFGGRIVSNDISITRDLYSKTLKVCIEYDGIWHFKDIHGQLEDKQRKDEELKKWCETNGYRLIRIDEDWYNNNKDNKLKTIESLVYNNSEQLILLGDRY